MAEDTPKEEVEAKEHAVGEGEQNDNVVSEEGKAVDLTGGEQRNDAEKAIEEAGGTTLVSPDVNDNVSEKRSEGVPIKGAEMSQEELETIDADTTRENEEAPGAVGAETLKDAVDKDVLESVTDAANEAPVSEKEAQNDKYAEEKPITHVKNMTTKNVFDATPHLMKRRDLFPCDKDGNLVHDHRSFQ